MTTASPSGSRSYYFRPVIRQTLGVDGLLAFVSLLLGVLLGGSLDSIEVAADLNKAALIPPFGSVVFVCGLPALIFLFVDVLSALSNPAVLPFARSKAGLKKIYAKRLHLLLLVSYFASILAALCWLAVNMLLVSKLFISAVFAFALYALGQSIPSRRLGFVVSGVLFLVVLLGIQVLIATTQKVDTDRIDQDDLVEPAEPAIPLYESGDE
ncbi:MAG: hypothetical protein WBB01_15800 [Phormidesmis sp.]